MTAGLPAVAFEDWVEHSVRSRLVVVMSAFPGMTPAQVWELPQIEWWLVATAADEWLAQKRAQASQRG